MAVQLILLRGLPGSGKSTLARELIKTLNAEHYEADMYFEDKRGNYTYDASRVGDAHRWCQTCTEGALKRGVSVIVANTFVKQWEMEPYKKMASELGVQLSVRVCVGEYRNIHDVPNHVIENMRKNWEE
ncbi:ATP-binding protein [Vibrio hannami]|uniref:ATP-binding protein n=1 Tax=Vibrio hannami TaxID=2717094 RepID=UPI0024105A71|nr:ATP-binding protein [Vibrio hannami]MDG3085428.1 ATP-binding protein [Vibrio hannami]